MSGIHWDRSPSELADAIEVHAATILAMVQTIADTVAQSMEGSAKQNAPWTDRTGNARQGLATKVIHSADGVDIILHHSVEYGIYLEVCNGGRYQIIIPTIIEYGPLFFSLLKAVMGG